MNPLGDLLTTRPILTGWKFTIKLYSTSPFPFTDDPDWQFGNGLIWTWIWTRGVVPELLLTVISSTVGVYSSKPMLVMVVADGRT